MLRFYSNPQTNSTRVVVVGTHSEGMLNIAVARCSKKDNFIKKKGRMIAEGRLLKGKFFKTIPLETLSTTEFIRIAQEQIIPEVVETKKVFLIK